MTSVPDHPPRVILNLMLGRKRGGLEQAALDYAEALQLAALPALTVISPGAWVEPQLVTAGLAHQSLANKGAWDPLAAFRLRRLARKTNAAAIICHGNRALGLALRALKGRIPVIAVTHNYNTGRFVRADHCFAITEHLAEHLRHLGIQQISAMPNMVRLTPHTPRTDFHTPPRIGSMGRFVHKKGFDIYLEALGILKTRGVAFEAVLGGNGRDVTSLESIIAGYGLQQQVTLCGWVQDKRAFFEGLDIFVLPSRHEAFGIVLIEAMVHGVPVITTDSEGPREIIRHETDGLITKLNDATALADALEKLLKDAPYAQQLARSAYQRVSTLYSAEAMAGRLQTALAPYI